MKAELSNKVLSRWPFRYACVFTFLIALDLSLTSVALPTGNFTELNNAVNIFGLPFMSLVHACMLLAIR